MKRHISIFAFLLGAFAAGTAFAAEWINIVHETSGVDLKFGNSHAAITTSYPTLGLYYHQYYDDLALTAPEKAGYTISWLTLPADDTTSRGDNSKLANYTVKIADGGTLATNAMATAKRSSATYFGGYRVARLKYDAIPLTVTFNPNGGSGTMLPIGDNNYDSSFSLKANAYEKTGYSFNGWTNDLAKAFADEASVKGSDFWDDATGKFHADLYARWTANTYTVTFNGNGGGTPSMASKAVTYGSTYGDLATCSRTGYMFAGWWTAASGGTKVEKTTAVTITAAQTLYAHWTANTYTVTVAPNGGTGGSCPGYTVSAAQQTKTITVPTRTGYSISGWTVTGATGGTPTAAGTTLTIPANVSGNLTLTPSWSPVSYSITYTGLKEGSTHSGNPTSYTIETADIVFNPASDVTEYKFNGWSPDTIRKGSTGNKTVTATYLTKVDPPVANTPLTYNGSEQSCAWSASGRYEVSGNRQMEPGEYLVTFTLVPGCCWSDGSVTNRTAKWEILNASLSDVTVEQSGSLVYTGKPQTPTVFHQATAVGQKTVTWTYSASGSDFSPTVPSFTEIGEHTVYYKAEAEYHNIAVGSFTATIEDSRYTIEFEGGAGAEGSMEPVTLIHDEPYVVANVFTKKGCEFVTWRTVIGGVATNFDVGATISNLTTEAGTVITFTADWLGRYTVAFDANGGTGTMTNLTYETGVEYALPSNAFAKTGYRFYGWATSLADAVALKKPVYTNGQEVVDLAVAGGICTLFAEWTTNRYKVVFNPNASGVRETMEPQDFFYDQEKELSPNRFTRGELWSFAGWSNSVGRVFENRDRVSNLCADDGGTVELFARWASELGPLSEAMGCDNLKWESESWKVCDSEGSDGPPCVWQHGGDYWGMYGMYAHITTNGVLSFKYKLTAEVDTIRVIVGQSWEGDPVMSDAQWTFTYQEGEEWQNAVCEIPALDWDSAYIRVYRHCQTVDESGIAYVDKMTWVSEGANPEPTDADKVTISSAAVSDGKFSLSFASKAEFDYNLLTNANLLIDSWGVMTNEVGTGGTITFEPKIIEGQPQMFYKVETIQRK